MSRSEPLRAMVELDHTAGTVAGSMSVAGARREGFDGKLELLGRLDRAAAKRTSRTGDQERRE